MKAEDLSQNDTYKIVILSSLVTFALIFMPYLDSSKSFVLNDYYLAALVILPVVVVASLVLLILN
jgi:hypothetical protein